MKAMIVLGVIMKNYWKHKKFLEDRNIRKELQEALDKIKHLDELV